jgi:hypothetical protein
VVRSLVTGNIILNGILGLQFLSLPFFASQTPYEQLVLPCTLHHDVCLTTDPKATKPSKHGLKSPKLKDGLQKVPKGDKWSRRHLSFPGNLCLHPRGISVLRQRKKAIKTQSPTLPTGPPGSGSPCIPHYAVFLSFLFSTNKIFPTSAAGVRLCFHSQRMLESAEHLKFLHVSSVHQNSEQK